MTMASLLSFVLGLASMDLVSVVFTSLLVYFMIKFLLACYDYQWRLKHIRKLPGLPGHWLLGALSEFPGPGEEGLLFFRDRMINYPKMVYLFYGPVHVAVSVHHPDSAKCILKTSEPKPRDLGAYRLALPWLGEGLLIAGGKKWSRNRRLLTPAFHFDILRQYIAVNNKAADVLVEKISSVSKKQGNTFEVFRYISLCTLEIILKCAFSYNDDIQSSGEDHPYVKAVFQLSQVMVYRLLRPWLYPDLLFYLSPVGRQFRRNCDYVHGIADEIIKKRRETLIKEDNPQKHKYLDFVDILLTAKDENGMGLTRQEIRNEVDTFLFEGHDTTASGISWTLYSLAQHPEWQKKCQEEIDAILDGRDSDYILWEDLSKLSTLTLCIKEALRLHSPVPYIQRYTTKDIYVDGYFLPAGTQIDIHLYNILHNETVWDKPLVYDPERFLHGKASEMDNFAFIPFSAGPRNCIGQNFAMHEMKIITARILRRFHLEIDPSRPVKHEIIVVMKTEDGMYLRVTPRNIKK